jgi:hypothetical protein
MNFTIYDFSLLSSLTSTKSAFSFILLAALALISPARGGNLDFPDSLVAHWAFNEMAGATVRDSSTNHFDAIMTGGAWTNGVVLYDGAVDFATAGQGLFVGGDGSPIPDQIASLNYGSIAIRFKFPNTGSSTVIVLLYDGAPSQNAPDASNLILEIGHANDPTNRKLYFTIINKGFCFDTGVNLLPDTWYHYVCVVGPNGNTGYLNGQELVGRHYNLGSDATYTNFFSSVAPRDGLSIGCGRYVDQFLYGPATISDVQIYNRPLTPTEVFQLYRDVNDTGVFKVNGPTPSVEGDGMVLTWPSAANYTYNIFQADTPTGPWQLMPNFTNIAPMPPLNACLIPFGSAPNALFRVQAAWQNQ